MVGSPSPNNSHLRRPFCSAIPKNTLTIQTSLLGGFLTSPPVPNHFASPFLQWHLFCFRLKTGLRLRQRFRKAKPQLVFAVIAIRRANRCSALIPSVSGERGPIHGVVPNECFPI